MFCENYTRVRTHSKRNWETNQTLRLREKRSAGACGGLWAIQLTEWRRTLRAVIIRSVTSLDCSSAIWHNCRERNTLAVVKYCNVSTLGHVVPCYFENFFYIKPVKDIKDFSETDQKQYYNCWCGISNGVWLGQLYENDVIIAVSAVRCILTKFTPIP